MVIDHRQEGVDIWYTNTKPVRVSPNYNKQAKAYDYSVFGEVLEQEVLYDNNQTLTK